MLLGIEETNDMIEAVKLLERAYCDMKTLMQGLENITLTELEKKLVALRAVAALASTFGGAFAESSTAIEQKEE